MLLKGALVVGVQDYKKESKFHDLHVVIVRERVKKR